MQEEKPENATHWTTRALAKAVGAKIPPKTIEAVKLAGEAMKKLTGELQQSKTALTQVETELAKPQDRKFALSILGVVHGSALLEMFHIKRILQAADSKKEFAVKADKGLISYDVAA